jgi:hypothetical protein
MITDALLQLSAAQAVTATAVSTNTIDLGTARDIGTGEPLEVDVTVDVTATAAGAATVNFQVISSAAAALTSPTIVSQTDAIPVANLTAGRKPIRIRISPHVLNALPIGQRYLGLQYTVGTGPLTAGAFTASIVRDGQDVGKNYPSGFTVF